MTKAIVAMTAACALPLLSDAADERPDLEVATSNLWMEATQRLSVAAFADVESAYWARGVIVDKHPFSAQYAGMNVDLAPFGRLGGYAWSVSSMSREGQAATRRNAYNEVDYGVSYGYALDLAEGWALDTWVGPKWVTLPGYRPHANTIHEWNVGQSLKNPFVTPYYLMRRAYRPDHGWCYWDVGLIRAWELCDRLTLTATAFAELGDARHLRSQYGPNPHGDGSYSHGIMALNLLLRLDYAVTEWLGLFAFVHQFNTVNSDGRDALDANTNPESLKDLTIFGVGAAVKF